VYWDALTLNVLVVGREGNADERSLEVFLVGKGYQYIREERDNVIRALISQAFTSQNTTGSSEKKARDPERGGEMAGKRKKDAATFRCHAVMSWKGTVTSP